MTLEGSLSSLEFEEELKLDTSSLERKTKKDRLAPFTAEEQKDLSQMGKGMELLDKIKSAKEFQRIYDAHYNLC